MNPYHSFQMYGLSYVLKIETVEHIVEQIISWQPIRCKTIRAVNVCSLISTLDSNIQLELLDDLTYMVLSVWHGKRCNILYIYYMLPNIYKSPKCTAGSDLCVWVKLICKCKCSYMAVALLAFQPCDVLMIMPDAPLESLSKCL